MDEIDRANELAQKDLDAAIAAARGVQPAEMESADCCIECGCEIPSTRRSAVPGCQHCIDCATRLEDRKLRGLV